MTCNHPVAMGRLCFESLCSMQKLRLHVYLYIYIYKTKKLWGLACRFIYIMHAHVIGLCRGVVHVCLFLFTKITFLISENMSCFNA